MEHTQEIQFAVFPYHTESKVARLGFQHLAALSRAGWD